MEMCTSDRPSFQAFSISLNDGTGFVKAGMTSVRARRKRVRSAIIVGSSGVLRLKKVKYSRANDRSYVRSVERL